MEELQQEMNILSRFPEIWIVAVTTHINMISGGLENAIYCLTI